MTESDHLQRPLWMLRRSIKLLWCLWALVVFVFLWTWEWSLFVPVVTLPFFPMLCRVILLGSPTEVRKAAREEGLLS